jgi:hypothetical protein
MHGVQQPDGFHFRDPCCGHGDHFVCPDCWERRPGCPVCGRDEFKC